MKRTTVGKEKRGGGSTYLIRKAGGHSKQPKYWHVMAARKKSTDGEWATRWCSYIGNYYALRQWVKLQIELDRISFEEAQALLGDCSVNGYHLLPKRYNALADKRKLWWV